MKIQLPKGARWAPGYKRYFHLHRGPFYRMYGQTTVYTGRYFTPAVYCDSQSTADKVLERLSA